MLMLKFDEILNDCDAIVFDFDGTLIDSEKHHLIAHNIILSELLKREFVYTKEEFSKYIGIKDTVIFEEYKQIYNLDNSVDEMVERKTLIARDLLLEKDVKIFDYFQKLLEIKGDKKFYIASNQDERLLIPVMKEKGIFDKFEKIFCLSKMGVEKDYFYRNINEFISHDTAKNVAVFEDSETVVKSIKDLGYIIFGVETNLNRNKLKPISSYTIAY